MVRFEKQSLVYCIPLMLCGLVFFISLRTSPIEKRAWAGDEMRYVLYSMGFFENGRFAGTHEVREVLLQKIGPLPYQLDLIGILDPPGSLPSHPVFMGMVLSPLTSLYAIQGGRIGALIIGVAGLWFLFYLCLQHYTLRQATLATYVGGLSIPALPYFGLFLPEIILFALICSSWYLLNRGGLMRKSMGVALLLIFCLPFIHLRGSTVAACLFMLLVVKQLRFLSSRQDRIWFVSGAVSAAIGAGFVFYWFNLSVYQDVFGSANTARPHFSVDAFSLAFFNFRHGLLTFSPIWILSVVGLLTGMRKRDRLSYEASALLLCAGIPTIGPYAGECWPARFFVAAVPMLVIGFGAWLTLQRSYWENAVFLLLGLITFANTLLFVFHSNIFLTNRNISETYNFIFNILNIEYRFDVYADMYGPIFPNHVLFPALFLFIFFLSLPHLWKRSQTTAGYTG